MFGKNDKGQMGIGSGIGIDMYESESIPIDVKFEKPVFVKDFHCGQNTMIIKDDEE